MKHSTRFHLFQQINIFFLFISNPENGIFVYLFYLKRFKRNEISTYPVEYFFPQCQLTRLIGKHSGFFVHSFALVSLSLQVTQVCLNCGQYMKIVTGAEQWSRLK